MTSVNTASADSPSSAAQATDAQQRAALLQRIADLKPVLRGSLAEVDTLARLPDTLVEKLDGTGVFDMMRPRAHGGMQTSLRTFMEVASAVGQADGSAGWTCALINVCNWMAGSCLPGAARDEVFAAGAKVRTAGVLTPRMARTRRIEDGRDRGWLIEEGVWGFNSGIYHAQWDLLGIPLVDKDGQKFDEAMALLPISDVELLHDWDTMALRGSGSTSVRVTNKFVPDWRVTRFSSILKNDYAAQFGDEDALYRMAFVPVAAIILVFPALGMARAALELFLEKLPQRGILYTDYEKQGEAAVTHLQVGQASALIDAAHQVVGRCVDEIEAHARRGDMPDPLLRARIRRDTGFASKLVWDAVDMLASASGGSLAASRNPMNRIWRDARVANLHSVVCTSTNLELYGRMLCGQPPNTFLV